ncbi:hypothetical protein [Pontibacter burrus]|uniref:STAS/SEC14 domain-containing protein n=1 Tax=Pontibacter burrus TaxID=2704466 RepID=A0A6B3LPR3_9BACT|nr:hypothetical protein [Pontibacter burrus]NEM97833.1 hypothetical protein [Pontibacter burrus]
MVSLPDSGEWVNVVCTKAPDLESFKEGLLKALEYIREQPVYTWLLDLRAIEGLGEREETWVQVQFFPQLMMLGHEHYFAIVVSESCYQDLLQDVGIYGLKSYNSFIIINTFCHVADAELWLRNQRLSEVS